MQGTRIWPPIQEDPTWWGALSLCTTTTGPVLYSPGATTLEALGLQLRKPDFPRTCALQREGLLQWEASKLQLESSPHLPQLEKSPHSNEDPAQPEVN